MLTSGFALDEIARDVYSSIEEWVAGLSAVEWVALLFAGAAIGWVVANLRALTRLGPIDVHVLEHDENTLPVKSLTALFREALARTGLMPPPAVPGGTPQVNLLAAVEASNISQAAWVAKLISMVPRPRPHEYKISGTLLGEEPSPVPAGGAPNQAPAGPPPPPCGISVWVQPAREGSEMLSTFDGAATHKAAVERAATEVYLHISNQAVEAFPHWARWHERASLAAYRNGCRERANGNLDQALQKLEEAAQGERFNKLAELQLANLYEQQALLQATELRKALVEALALHRYLKILEDANTLVEAHYRASVVASALAMRCSQIKAPPARQLVVQGLRIKGLDRPERLEPVLRELAEQENRAVLQMLQPLFTVLNEFRLRTQFEPRAHQRRQLKHSAAISRHCVGARAMLDAPNSRRVTWDLRRRSASVHWRHLHMGWGNLSWRTRYNAACFDALLLERRRRLKEDGQG